MINTCKWKEYYKKEYSEWWEGESIKYKESAYYNLIFQILLEQKKKRVLDCGIGTGVPIGIGLAKSGLNVYGIDIAPGLLEKCRENVLKEEVNINLKEADVENIPYKDEFFDMVYCISSSWYFPDLKTALKEIFRVTKKEGIVVFDGLNIFHPSQFINVVENKIDNLVRCFIGKSPQYYLTTDYFRIKKILKNLNIKNFKVKGFDVLLPTHLSIIKQYENISKFTNLFSYGLQDSLLKYLGLKLLFICHK